MIGTFKWSAIGIKHTLKGKDSHVDGIDIKLKELLPGQQPPVYVDVLKKSRIVLWFQNADVANKYKAAIRQTRRKWKIFGDETGEKTAAKKDSSWMNSKWIRMERLPRGTTRKQIADHIEKHGKLKIPEKDIYLGHIDRDPSKKDWARIECLSNEDAVKIVTSISRSKFSGSEIIVRMGRECTSRILLIGNLGPDVTEQDVANHISDHGKIKNRQKSITLTSGGTALVEFEKEKDANQRMRKLNGTQLKGRKVIVLLRGDSTKNKYRKHRIKMGMKSSDKLNSKKPRAEKKLTGKRRKK